MGYLNLKPEQTNIFFKLIEERYRRKFTIITTNLEYEEWGSLLNNKALVDTLLCRLWSAQFSRLRFPRARPTPGAR